MDTHNRADVAGATAGAGGTDGAGQPVETVFAGGTSGARRTLREQRGREHGGVPSITSGTGSLCSPQEDAPTLAGGRGSGGDLLVDQQDQKHQKDLVHQERPVQRERGEKGHVGTSLCSGTWGSNTHGHRHPVVLTGGPGGPWRPEKPR